MSDVMKARLVFALIIISAAGVILIGPSDIRYGLAQAQEQQDHLSQLEAQVKRLETRIEALEAQLKQLAAAPTTATKPRPEAPAGIPDEIDRQIREKAEERYPDNFSTQKTMIKIEREAYLELQTQTSPEGVPEEVFQKMRDKAKTRYPESFSTQKTMIKIELEAYQELQE